MDTDLQFLDKLLKLCVLFDKEHGTYPEHSYEGEAVYTFICEELGYDPTFENGFWEKSIENC